MRLWLALAAMSSLLSTALPAPAWQQPLEAGIRAREGGDIHQAVALLERAVDQASDPSSRTRATTQLGLTLLQAGRLTEADSLLQSAYRQSNGAAHLSVALALGNVAASEREIGRATHYYEEVIAAAGETSAMQAAKLVAELDLARLQDSPRLLSQLQQLYARLTAMEQLGDRARAYFSLGLTASRSSDPSASDSSAANELADRSFSTAADLAQQAGDTKLRVECAEALAELYEAQSRWAEAANFNRAALALAAGLPLGSVEAILVRLEWRAGRLDHRRGDDAAALAHELRASRYLEAIRQDLPIADETGQSTYQTLQRPLFADLMDLMLKNIDGLATDERPARLNAVLEAIELTHQAEMQDYLGERCAVETVGANAATAPDPGVAVVYTVVLEDRLEVIVRTHRGLLHHAAAIRASALEAEISSFRRQLIDYSSTHYLVAARRLYGWLIAPFEEDLASAGVRELVIVPDRYLRLIPFAALHDGQGYLAERYVVSSVTGLTMTAGGRRAPTRSLLAGLSEPGPVVGRLIELGYLATTDTDWDRNVMVLATPAQRALSAENGHAGQESALRRDLLLPAVQTEIQAIEPFGRSVPLLNADFTVARFEREVRTGRYGVIHIATHGHFGDHAKDSFLLAFDDVIQMDDLQTLISDNGRDSDGIELLTLSACETAKGDDRAPLGFAGAAIKARARTVVGTLWAVNDEAAEQFMQVFYAGMGQRGKAQAFTQAQRALIRSTKFSHPYYWAPIVLFGDWS